LMIGNLVVEVTMVQCLAIKNCNANPKEKIKYLDSYVIGC
jgi:hypothetical protein